MGAKVRSSEQLAASIPPQAPRVITGWSSRVPADRLGPMSIMLQTPSKRMKKRLHKETFHPRLRHEMSTQRRQSGKLLERPKDRMATTGAKWRDQMVNCQDMIEEYIPTSSMKWKLYQLMDKSPAARDHVMSWAGLVETQSKIAVDGIQ